MNEYDSNRISDLVKIAGYERTNNIENIDCYVLNTCHIRDKATEKVYSDIGRLKKSYKNKIKPLVLITGCVAQAENQEMLKREPYIDAVVGPQSYHNFPKILSNLNNKKKKLNFTDFDVIEKFDKLNSIKNLNSNVASYITIQEGCDKFCNFCVVPYTRGPEHSRSPSEIFKEAKNLIRNGAKEIILLGQNVNAYNYNNEDKVYKLSHLISTLENFKDLKRIRFTTSHPKDMTIDLINCYKNPSKLVPFLHLPVQSGSNKILKAMNRKHSKEDYLLIVKHLKKINSKIKFSSDFIVGYPGETEEDFKDTISLIKEVKFINSFSYIFNQRPGTPAAKLKFVDKSLQKKRLSTLQSLLSDIQLKENKMQVGKIMDILVENKLKNQSKFFGRTKYFTPVILSNTNNDDIGKTIRVRIDECNNNGLFGTKENIKEEVAA